MDEQRRQKMIAIAQVLERYTMPIEQFGFVTIDKVADEILKAINQ